jgi:RNA polymerase sigma-70 factor (ECF subfamily)
LLGVVALRAVRTTTSGALPSDGELVTAARAREGWACEALIRRHAPRINGLALRLIGRDADVDDLVQDTFASAFASLHNLKEPNAFGGWLTAILVRTASKLIRRRRLLARLGLGRDALAIDLDALVGPSIPADHAAELRRLYALAEKLPADLRVPLLLRRVEGLELEEIKKLTGSSIATIKRRIVKAEDLLRTDFLKGEGR